ncbi:MarR family winged helix-turn-helix transcriptional regulator [Kribbella shirazensis]|uniref:DNA-binding MarR family transcriptional regulator n=1 Tax=Kribbella shirazensis TaxID=1105143 RepID=A0A7X6A520_9ACTN|nr:MarR family winged helix-turn-helix transcriptional regulator [Kribbella shirazensis]NIK62147.1 DNA-binding MarR family transcriptional regulator [Kribbella shirazensis]
MSRPQMPRLDRKPLIALVERANRALQTDMVRRAHADGHAEVKMAHNSVFGTLYSGGSRAADMAARAGITRQSMGEVIRDMVALDLLEMRPDPDDGRAKVVGYTEHGLDVASDGRRHLIQLERRLAEEFGEHEYDTARDVLERLVDVLDRLATEQDQDSPSAGGSVG